MLRSHPADALSVTVIPTGLVTLRFPVILKVTLTFIVPDSDANTPPLPTGGGVIGEAMHVLMFLRAAKRVYLAEASPLTFHPPGIAKPALISKVSS